MSHQLSATHLVYRLTGKPSAVPLRKIGTLSLTGMMPALLAACGSSSSTTTEIGTPVTATSAFLITGGGQEGGFFGQQVLGFDTDGDGPSEIAVFGRSSVYISKLPPTNLTTNNYFSVGEYETRNAIGWTFSNVTATAGQVGFTKIAAGDLNGDGFEDIVIGEPLQNVVYRSGFTYSDPSATAPTTDPNDDVVSGHTLAAGVGRVSVVYGGPHGVVGAGTLDFNQDFADAPTGGYTPEVYTADGYSNVAGAVLLGGRIAAIGSEVAVGNVLDGTDFSGAELLVVSSGRAADTTAAANPNEGIRISIINGASIGNTVRYLVETNEAIVGATDPSSVAFANTVSAWTIYTGAFEDPDRGGAIVREVADSPLAIGDIGGSDTADVIVGRYFSNAGTDNTYTGQVHVVYGRGGSDVTPEGATDASGDPIPAGATDVVLHSAGWEGTNNANGFTVSGFPSGTDPKDRAFAGASVAAADINGDGKKDLIIGTPGNTQEFNAGQVYVIYGADSGLGNIDVSVANWHGTNYERGFEIKHSDPTGGDGLGVLGAGNLGASVTSVGDFNNDGIEDIAIGAPTFSPSQTLVRGGAAYIIFGRDTNWSVSQSVGDPVSDNTALQVDFSGNILLDQANWSNGGQYGFRITSSQADARMGLVSGLGDVNGDTITDVGIAAVHGGTSGAVFALYGADQNAFADLSIDVPSFPRTRDGVAVDANGQPIVTEETTPITPVVPGTGTDTGTGTGTAAASTAPDSFFDVA